MTEAGGRHDIHLSHSLYLVPLPGQMLSNGW